MTFFNNATDIAISGGTFTAINTAPTWIGIEKLVKVANPNAMHNSKARYDPPKCHPGTREAILERIMRWIFGSDDKDSLILWLYGPAGAGKSAILQTIAEKCAALDILLASFFFSRSDVTRNHPDSLVATIAYQISTRIPQITTALDAAIVRDPMIFDKTIDVQIEVLIVGPLTYLMQCGFFADPKSSPRLILIDGLDECNKEEHRGAVLHAVTRALRVHNLPFIFLISSRPETDIRFSFDSPDLANLWNSLVLDDSYMAYKDIRLFLNDSFRSIKETHPMKGYIPPLWPNSSAVDTLVTKSSGQFIYASTVIKYISALRASPSRQLDTILGILPARSGDMPFAELDALYNHILSSVEDTELMLDILAILMGYFKFGLDSYPVSPRLLDISHFLGVDQEDVNLVFSSLVSITVFAREGGVWISHASLSDALADRKRSGRFHIDRTKYTARLAHQGVRWLVSLKSGPPPKNLSFNMLDILRRVFTSFRLASQISEELYQDLQSLPLDLIWHETQHSHTMSQWADWRYMFEWLLTRGKFHSGDTISEVDLRYQGLFIEYATHIKTLVKVDFDGNNKVKHFLALIETLAHDFVLNGTCYDKSLSKFLNRWTPFECSRSMMGTRDRSLTYMLFKTISLSDINAGENPYIHTALRLIKSLTTWPDAFWPAPSGQHYDSLHYSLRWITSGNRRQLSEFVRQRLIKLTNPDVEVYNDSGLRWLRSWDCQLLSELIRQPKRNNINSGRIYRIQRHIRLNKLQAGIRDNSWTSHSAYTWNRDLVLKFLIPVLDQCPKSDELLALINRRIRHVFLQYTPRRRLRDAVYRYIRRTSDVGSN